MSRFIINGTMTKKMYFDRTPFWEVGNQPPEKTPFYLESGNGQVQTVTIFKRDSSSLVFPVEYSLDKVNWTSLGNVSTDGISVSVLSEGKVFLRASTTTWNNVGFKDGSNIKAGGNIMSLLYGSDFNGTQTILPSTNTFYNLFYNWQSITDASKLLLPAPIMTERCYSGLFLQCRSLITGPELPATTLAVRCYENLFGECNNMQGTVYLPALTLEAVCYGAMFSNCGVDSIVALAVNGFTRGDNPNDPLWCFMYNTKHPGVLYKNPECDVLNWTSSNRSGVRSDRGWVVVDYQG